MAVLNKHKHGIPEGAVYIGRGSKWGNPFIMRHEGERKRVCEQFEAHLLESIERNEIQWSELAELHGKDLVCYCAPKQCHGHVLEKYAQAAAQGHALPSKEYKLIFAGGRDFIDYEKGHAVLFSLAEQAGDNLHISIVSGMARGADRVGYEIAKAENIKCYEFPADWNQYGKRAGYVRNENMARVADGLLAFWDGKSRGTAHMIRIMQALGKPVEIVRY